MPTGRFERRGTFEGRLGMAELIIIVLLLVMVYFLWVIRRALVHTCAQLALLCKFTQEIKCHVTGTEPNPEDDINKVLGLQAE
jgi:hypothetical protein